MGEFCIFFLLVLGAHGGEFDLPKSFVTKTSPLFCIFFRLRATSFFLTLNIRFTSE